MPLRSKIEGDVAVGEREDIAPNKHHAKRVGADETEGESRSRSRSRSSRKPKGRSIWRDIRLCIGFYTVIPVGSADEQVIMCPPHEFAAAQWAAPLAGALIGAIGAALFTLADRAGLSVMVAAVLTLSGTILLTGALHEDGMADVADGFGGGRMVARKLEIMKDSCVGTYGVLALLSAFFLRLAALIALASPLAVALGLIGAHMGSRALIPAFMRSLPAAQTTGLSATAGQMPMPSIIIALILGVVGLVMTLQGAALYGVPLLALYFMLLRALALAQIGGQTGDVLGTLQQGAEVIVLVIASRVLMP